MKPYLLLTFLLTSFYSIGQNEKIEEKEKIQISLGYGIVFNNLNSNSYYKFKDANYEDFEKLQALILKVSFPTKKEHINLFVGTLFQTDISDVSLGYTPGNTNSFSHSFNGGGVFGGINPVLKHKYFGLTSEFAIGIFSFKERFVHFNNITEPFQDINAKEISYGLGAYSSLGFYLKWDWIGINPNLNVIYTGGENASFLFYGFNIPLTFQF